jgi:NAD(P)-dependent dehydrogenase (short-subunit alcohol dehydrogenase family)
MTAKILDGQVAIVTGGSGSIGRAICRCLAAHGAKVIVHYRAAEDEAHELVAGLERDGLEARAIGADLSTARGCETLIVASDAAFGTATILVNNAGMQPVADFEQISAADLASMLATNVQGPFRLMQLFAERVIGAGIRDASIVNVASIEGSRPAAGHSHYSTAKASLIMCRQAWLIAKRWSTTGPRALNAGAARRRSVVSASRKTWQTRWLSSRRRLRAGSPATTW